jgi:hypothetical protein
MRLNGFVMTYTIHDAQSKEVLVVRGCEGCETSWNLTVPLAKPDPACKPPGLTCGSMGFFTWITSIKAIVLCYGSSEISNCSLSLTLTAVLVDASMERMW